MAFSTHWSVLRPEVRFFSSLLLVGVLLWSPVHAKPSLTRLEGVRKEFSGQEVLRFKTRKVTKTLTRDRIFHGVLTAQNGKIHWETTGPSKGLVVYDGSYLFTVQYPIHPGEKKQIVKMATAGKKNVFLKILDAKVPLSEGFLLKSVKNQERRVVYKLEPKDQSVSDVQIAINKKNNQIVEISYTGDIGDRTEIFFGPKEETPKLTAKFFTVDVKGAVVTEQ